jgi:anti-sigma B factor antagonist
MTMTRPGPGEPATHDDPAGGAAALDADAAGALPGAPMWLALHRRRLDDGREVVALAGELDLAGVASVRSALAGCDSRHVVVDLARLEFIDARGVSALVDAARTLGAAGGRLELHGSHGLVRRVLDVLEADGLLGGLALAS